MLRKGGWIIPKYPDITKVDTLYLMTKHAHRKMGILRKTRIRGTLNLLVCANNNTAFLLAHYLLCAAISIVYAFDVAVRDD